MIVCVDQVDGRTSIRPLKMEDHITGFVFAVDAVVGWYANVVMPQAIVHGVNIHRICGVKTGPGRRDLSFESRKIPKTMLLKFLSESQDGSLLRGRVVGKLDSEFSIVMNGVRQSRILAEGLALLCFLGHCENVLAHFVQ